MNTQDLWVLQTQDQGAQQMNPGPEIWNGNDSEMYKKTLDALMEKVNAKYGELNSLRFASNNQNMAKKNDIVKTIFEAMKSAGIDPSDAQAINEFMMELEANNPDLYELFTEAMDALLWPDPNSTNDPLSADETTGVNQQSMQPWQPVQPTVPEPSQPSSPVDPTQSPPGVQM